ncbi:MAG: UDP-glucose 4-epimerase GalE [Alphaproteobacteria bacterium]|nr:UDP-glucose 4-epimerase GalE [Alphaproteobacteria bacterium]
MAASTLPHVLVTGGAGYIGSHAVLALLDAGARVSVLDDLSTGFRWAVPEGAAFHRGDVGDERLVARILQEQEIGAIMHFAGSLLIAESMANPLAYYLNNTAKSRTLIECAVKAGVPHFVFSSTCASYGVPDVVPIREDTPQRPINPYGRSKLMTETMLRDVAASSPLSYCALRYFNVAGADPRMRSGESTIDSTHLIKIAAEVVHGLRPSIAVFGTDYPTRDGTGVRDYIHVWDLAEAHVAALRKLIAEPGRSLELNCGYGRGYSVFEVLDAVDRIAGTKIARRIGPRRPGDPPELVADNSKILAALDWRPRHDDLDTIIGHALAWERCLAERRA